MSRSSYWHWVFCFATACGGAQSETSTPSGSNARDESGDREEGKAKFESGMKAMEEGDLDEACDSFREALEADKSFGPMVALGSCLEKQEQYASALRAYQDAFEMLEEGDERGPMVKELAAGIEDRVASLTVLFPQNAPEKTVVEWEDEDMLAEQFGVPLLLDPGTYRLEVKAQGRDDRDYDVTLAPGETRTLQLELGEP